MQFGKLAKVKVQTTKNSTINKQKVYFEEL